MTLFGCDFSGIIYKIDSSFSDALEHATVYQALETKYFNEILEHASEDKSPFRFFVDIGAGKGEACILASKSQKFEKIIGVEISEPLIKIATKNMEVSQCDNVTFIHEDARSFEIPNGKTLFFMYNPFDSVILEKFIAINRTKIKQTNSVISYLNDEHRWVLERAGFKLLYKNEENLISLWK
jgi:predicted RNA methylase